MRITLPSGVDAEVAGEASARGLVVIPDIMGLRPLFDDLVAWLAADWGCRVCAPNLYAGQTGLDLPGRFAAASSLEDAAVLADVVAAADLAGGERVGLIGFCMGGMYALKAVSTGRFDRVVPFYGMIRVPTDWAGPGQGEPLDHLAAGDPTSVLAVIGGEDPYTPPADVADLSATGAAVAAYPDAEHGFVHDPGRPAHRAEDAADAWARAGRWLWE
ncbi:MAG: dienelactone hydrolase family protein [Acidimicrobiales bacterium]